MNRRKKGREKTPGEGIKYTLKVNDSVEIV